MCQLGTKVRKVSLQRCHMPQGNCGACISKNTRTDQQEGDTKWLESSEADTQKCDELPLYTISDKPNKPFLVKLQVKGSGITFEMDNGTAVSIMSEDNVHYHLKTEPILKSTLQLKMCTKDKIPVICEVKVWVSYNNQRGVHSERQGNWPFRS